jgi:heat shock protein HtpX
MKSQLKTLVLLGALSALLVGLGAAVAPGYLYLFGALAVAMNIGAYFFSDRLVLRMHGAQEVGPHEAPALHAMIAELAEKAGIPKPRLFLIRDAQPNAFATGRNPAHGVVAVTDGIMGLLDRRELRAVLAHEIAHIKNRDILLSTIAATIAAVITYVANALSFASLFGGARDDEESSPASGLLMAFVAPIAATLVQLGISRSREYLADETGARIAGDPLALASALAKLEQGVAVIPTEQPQAATASLFIANPFAGAGGVTRLFSTHPQMDDRIRRLEELARRWASAVEPPRRLRSALQYR